MTNIVELSKIISRYTPFPVNEDSDLILDLGISSFKMMLILNDIDKELELKYVPDEKRKPSTVRDLYECMREKND